MGAQQRQAGRLAEAERVLLEAITRAEAEGNERVASQALEIFGGVGFTKDFPAEKFYRDAKIGRIYEGTSNMQRMTIAKQLLGK